MLVAKNIRCLKFMNFFLIAGLCSVVQLDDAGCPVTGNTKCALLRAVYQLSTVKV